MTRIFIPGEGGLKRLMHRKERQLALLFIYSSQKNEVTERSSDHLGQSNLEVAPFTSQTRGSFFITGNRGVHRLDCEHCNAVYVGQTGISFVARLKGHLRPC